MRSVREWCTRLGLEAVVAIAAAITLFLVVWAASYAPG